MAVETARILVLVVAGCGGVVWLIALVFVQKVSAGPNRERSPESALLDESTPTNFVYRSVEIEGEPSELLTKATELLAKGESVGSVKILSRTDDGIAFEGTDETMTHPRGGYGRWLRKGKMSFSSATTGRTVVEWVLELETKPWMLGLAWTFQVVSLLALAIGTYLILTFVVESPDPAVRGQSFQIIQVAHFIWPPFLFAGIYRRGRNQALTRFDTFVNNLPYVRS